MKEEIWTFRNAFRNEDNCVISFFLTGSLVFNFPSKYPRAQTVISEHVYIAVI